MCEQCENFEEEMMALAELVDPQFSDGSNPGNWLSWDPTISDRQLEFFEKTLSLMRTRLEHGGNGPRQFAEMEISPCPPNAQLALIRELQLYRALARMEHADKFEPPTS